MSFSLEIWTFLETKELSQTRNSTIIMATLSILIVCMIESSQHRTILCVMKIKLVT